MNLQENKVINGKLFYYAFLAGSKQILNSQSELNQINVYPVNDKDTGTNLASTVRAIIENIKPTKSYSDTIKVIANSALIGARGNSGAIVAQFLVGLSNGMGNSLSITFDEFALSVENSIPFIYDAIEKPVEGTILTVIRDWSDFLKSKKNNTNNLNETLSESLEVIEKSLNQTTAKLQYLSKYNVVDAGAKGFVLFIKGIVDFIKKPNIRELAKENVGMIELIHTEDIHDENITNRFCTEAVIKNTNINKYELKRILADFGDSIVIAGTESLSRIHVHTNKPSDLFHKLQSHGTITFQKAEDMIRQNEIATKRKWNIALVTDSTCDLSNEIIDDYQINVVPLNIMFGDNHYLDKITIQPEQFYDLLENSTNFPTTSQINEWTFTNLYSHLASHYDAIIAIHLTGEFSGTYKNSLTAGERIQKEFNKPVYVINSKNLSGALGLLVLKAAKYIESGESAESVAKLIESQIENAKIFVSVKDFKYMIKGGRVSGTKGKIAQLAGIIPVITMDQSGKSKLFGVNFSQSSSLKRVFRHIKENIESRDVWNYIILHSHNHTEASKIEGKMREMTGLNPVSVVNISPVIGMHAGKGAVAVAVLYNN